LKINFFKIKRFLLLLVLLAVLAFFYSLILKKVSPVFKPPENNTVSIERDYRGAININSKVDYKNPKDQVPDNKVSGQ